MGMVKRQSRRALALITSMAFSLGCGGTDQSGLEMDDDYSSKMVETEMAFDETPQAPRVAQNQRVPDQPTASNQARPRMIIITARLSCEVAAFNETLESIQKITAQYNGYVVTSTRNGGDRDYTYGEVILRVPSERFDETLQAIKQTVQTVESERIDGNDVSEQFYDLVARLDNKKKAERRISRY